MGKLLKARRLRRKNFLPTFILIIFFWSTFIFLIFFIEPDQVKDIIIPGAYLPFFINLFLALFFTLSVVFNNSRRGLLANLGVIAFLVLCFHGLGNLLNLLLIAGLLITIDVFKTKA